MHPSSVILRTCMLFLIGRVKSYDNSPDGSTDRLSPCDALVDATPKTTYAVSLYMTAQNLKARLQYYRTAPKVIGFRVMALGFRDRVGFYG